jgi:hypothetical protein
MDAKRLSRAGPWGVISGNRGGASSRKLRLLACGCCRALRDPKKVQYCLPNVEVAERFADGLATADELQAARDATYFVGNAVRVVGDALRVVEADALEAVRWVLESCQAIDGSEFWVWQLQKYRECRTRYSRLVADVFDLFDLLLTRAVPFDANWKTSTAVAVAQQMYDSRDFSAMPILADALQDAGCNNDDILNHCRDPEQPHIRGCWVIDLVLGKS